MSPNEILKEIADLLSANYYNVSIRPNQRNDSYELKEEVLSKIFNTQNFSLNGSGTTFEFSRNIVIIGAGAALSEFKNLSTGNQAIQLIEEKLGFIKLCENNFIKSRYIRLASHYFKTVYDDNTDLTILKNHLKFEGRLSILLNFYDKEDVLTVIKDILDIKYLFCHFYDIIAYFLKHKFIDAVVNFNFDEMLDNAISEEMMNEKIYHKIVHDSECKPIAEFIENDRLKFPLYIKPHGTISSKTSLLFTKEHYIDMSEDMRLLLNGLFHGELGKNDFENNQIKKINIIVCGFAMASIEFNNIIFSLAKNSKIITTIYFLNRNGLADKNEFDNNLKKWIDDNQIINGNPFRYRNIPTAELNETDKLVDHFKSIHSQIAKNFRLPFIPLNLSLYNLISLLFPSNKLDELGKKLLEKEFGIYNDYLRKRFIFHLLYDLVKNSGKLAINYLISDRAGKYFQLYKYFLKKSNSPLEKLNEMPDIITFLNEDLKIKMNEKDNDSDNIYICTDLFTSNNLHKSIDFISKTMVEKASFIDEEQAEEVKLMISEILKDEIYDKIIYNVSPQYDDVRLARFRYFEDNQIIHTNLNLTYKFFEYAILKEMISKNLMWDTLLFSSETAQPILNLHTKYHNTSNKSFLEEIGDSGKKINLICSTGTEINDKIKKIVGNNFDTLVLRPYENIHHMALFLLQDNPVYGFYFFKPEGKNRINPVFFEKISENDNNSNNFINLSSMKNLFNIQRKKALKK